MILIEVQKELSKLKNKEDGAITISAQLMKFPSDRAKSSEQKETTGEIK
jgi:hypothetical protein